MDIDDETSEELHAEADSLAGLLLQIKGEFPVLHERLKFKHFIFEILAIDNRRINKIKVTLKDGKKHQKSC